MNLHRERALAFNRKVDKQRKRDQEAGRASNFLGPKAYNHRERLNNLPLRQESRRERRD